MIYFLVNNDYHLLDAERHALELVAQGKVVTLIRVPHALERPTDESLFQAEAVRTFDSPVKGRNWMHAWPRYWATALHIQRTVHPTRDDVLVLYTEFELVNHLLINRFKAIGARVLHLEDGGVGTYLPFSRHASEPLTRKERLIALMTRALPGLNDTRFHKMNGIVFPWRPDNCFDCLCVYRQVEISRAIPVRLIEGNLLQPPKRLHAGRVLFLNERVYDYYQDAPHYFAGLELILDSLSIGYDEVFFKFHPRETGDWRARILTLLERKYPQIRVIAEQAPVEDLLNTYGPEALASYFATTLLNLEGTDIQPLYLYHLLEDMAQQPMLGQLTHLLTQWRYRFVENWSNVRSGYRADMQLHADQRAQPFTSILTSPNAP